MKLFFFLFSYISHSIASYFRKVDRFIIKTEILGKPETFFPLIQILKKTPKFSEIYREKSTIIRMNVLGKTLTFLFKNLDRQEKTQVS